MKSLLVAAIAAMMILSPSIEKKEHIKVTKIEEVKKEAPAPAPKVEKIVEEEDKVNVKLAPSNFKQLGVLRDSKFEYTYYSAKVLRHKDTDQWLLRCDGLYADTEGRVIVASDIYPEGTVLETETLGTCIVKDTGVNRNPNTLDVYCNF